MEYLSLEVLFEYKEYRSRLQLANHLDPANKMALQSGKPHGDGTSTFYNAWDIKFEVEEDTLASYGTLVPPAPGELSLAEDWNIDNGSANVDEEKTYSIYNAEHNGHLELRISAVHQCDICSEQFATKTQIYEHIAKAHEQKLSKKIMLSYVQRTCEYCNESYNYKGWHDHMKNVHNERAARYCFKCPKSFRSDETFFKHNRRVHYGDPISREVFEHASTAFKCDKCDKTFSCKKYLGSHYRNVHRKGTISDNPCCYCLKKFRTRDSLGHHIRNVHSSGGRTFPCSRCSSVLKSEAYLLTHVRRVHYDDGQLHPCNICGKSYRSPRYLSVHRKNAHKIKKMARNA